MESLAVKMNALNVPDWQVNQRYPDRKENKVAVSVGGTVLRGYQQLKFIWKRDMDNQLMVKPAYQF